MSRTVDRSSQGPAFGAGFEVGRSVTDVYLKKISVKESYFNETKYPKLVLSFLKGSQWISKSIPYLPPQAFDSKEDYNKSKLLVAEYLENIMYCYLPPSQIKRIMFDSTGFGLVGTVRVMKNALEERRFWEVPICLKTVPMPDGGVSVGKYPPFMNRAKNANLTLYYTEWEKGLYNKWVKKNKQI